MGEYQAVARQGRGSRSLRRSWWLPVLFAVLGAAAGGWVGLNRPLQASATVLVNPLPGNPFSPTGTGENLLNLQSEAQLLASDRVARAVAEDVGWQGDPRALLGGLAVTVPSNTQTLVVTYSASSERRAVRRAQAFADDYLATRKQRAQALVDRQTKTLKAQIADAQQEAEQLAASRGTVDGAVQRAAVDSQIQATLDRQQQLEDQLSQLTESLESPGDVVNAASPQASFGPVPAVAVFAGLGLAGFFVLGVVLALLRNGSRGKVRDPDDVEAYGLDLLGVVSRKAAARSRVMLLNGDPMSLDDGVPDSEVMSAIRTGVLTHRNRSLPMAVLLATASAGTPSAVTGPGLARSLAQADLRVALLDLGNRTESGSGLVEARPEARERPGLLEVLQGTADIEDAVRKLGNGIELVTAGDDVSAVQHLLVNPRMNGVLTALKARSEVVLVVAGAIHKPAVQSLVGRVDSVLVEVNERDARLRDLSTVAGLNGLEDSLAGVVYVAASGHRR